MNRSHETPGFRTLQDEELLARDYFTERWGEKSDMKPEDLDFAWERAKYYSAHLPYHNFEHTMSTLWKTMEFADLCEANGQEVNRKVLIVASLFHDASYDESHDSRGFNTKEDFSAALFAQEATLLRFSDEEVNLGVDAIKSTFVDNEPTSLEAKILVRSDIYNIGEDYDESFLPNNELTYVESLVRPGEMISGDYHEQLGIVSDEFKSNSIVLLFKYLRHDLSLGTFDTEFKTWHHQAQANLLLLTATITNDKVLGDLHNDLKKLMKAAAS